MKEITLEGMLPRVFSAESIPFSEVWKSTLTFRRGCFYLVEAASGGGKSSMCSFIYGARRDFEGRLLFDGNDTESLKIDQWQKLRRESLAYLPQELSLFPELTALQNIELKNSLTGYVEKGRIEEWLHILGIDSRRDYPVGRMSVGQQQRVGLIRAICQPFDFILLDEPVSHLDEENNRIAARMIMEEARRQGAGVISTSVGNPLLMEDALSLKL
ncbi:MAG: ATP-binding cassette domain-containing protein [Muribaculaceae bacterium]|nr:ATP-binding cassette domain-containing protein [Muribaculaceae bacterium]MDE6008290.1 ATP-binding cassette domain-containing protein [Muribaculaceae bacterium]MDE6793055.1 ATP-binding cassette domain-containing protein [Muribaculaceae bacterium]